MNNNKSNVSQWGFQWGDNIDWSVLNYTESYGRKFIRHPSGAGSVMSMNDGTDRNVLVLDAKYRVSKGYSYYINSKTDLGLTQYTETGVFTGDYQLMPYIGISDTTINAVSTYSEKANQDINTSKYNTDKLVSLGNKAEAANYCRIMKISHNGIEIGCDMPNINVLCRIYAAMKKLDSMDPTVIYYPELALSNWWSSSNYYCWSSTWYGNDGDYCRALTLRNNSMICCGIQSNMCMGPGLAVILEI